jgi:hypothetical protein
MSQGDEHTVVTAAMDVSDDELGNLMQPQTACLGGNGTGKHKTPQKMLAVSDKREFNFEQFRNSPREKLIELLARYISVKSGDICESLT